MVLKLFLWALKIGGCALLYFPFLLLAAFSLDSTHPGPNQDKQIIMLMGLPALFWIIALLADLVRIWLKSSALLKTTIAFYVFGFLAMFFYFVFTFFLLK